MNRLPPFGFCAPCRYVRAWESDLVQVALSSGTQLGVRLKGIKPTGARGAAIDFINTVLGQGNELSVFLPEVRDFAMNRPLDGCLNYWGYVFVGSEDHLAEMLVRAGLAELTGQDRGLGATDGD